MMHAATAMKSALPRGSSHANPPYLMQTKKQILFDELCKKAHSCNLCEGLEDRHPVLSHLNGNLDSKILFVGEAPGRLGADKYRIPFHGDATGRNFEHLISVAGLSREDIFITNCVLCNPRDEKGNNRKPTRREIESCRFFLKEIIKLIEPRVVVTLGVPALDSICALYGLKIKLSESVATSVSPNGGPQLFPLYHTSPLAMVHRRKQKMEEDFKKLGDYYADCK